MGKAIRTNKIKQYSESEIKKMKKDEFAKGCTATAISLFYLLRDKDGWGNVRLSRKFEEFIKLGEEIGEGRVSIYDLKKSLEEENNIFFEL